MEYSKQSIKISIVGRKERRSKDKYKTGLSDYLLHKTLKRETEIRNNVS